MFDHVGGKPSDKKAGLDRNRFPRLAVTVELKVVTGVGLVLGLAGEHS